MVGCPVQSRRKDRLHCCLKRGKEEEEKKDRKRVEERNSNEIYNRSEGAREGGTNINQVELKFDTLCTSDGAKDKLPRDVASEVATSNKSLL